MLASSRFSMAAALAALPLVLALAACGSRPTDLAQARGYIERHDTAAAEVALKAYLQAHPDSGEARYLLGTQLLQRREAASALIELERAHRLGHDPSQVVPAQARALLAAGRPRSVIDELASAALADPAAQASLAASVAQAWLREGDAARAKAVVEKGLQAAPDAEPLQLMQLWLSEPTAGVAATRVGLDALLARHPGSADAWVYRAELLMRGQTDAAGAIEAYRKALALRPDHFKAQANLVALLLQRQERAQAREAFAVLKKLAPRYLATGLLEARLAISEGDFAQARTVYQAMLRSMSEHPTLLLAAAENELRLGDRTQAEVLASKLMARYPADVGARRLLAQLHLANGLPGKAAAVLAPIAGRADAPADVLAWAAQAELLDGRPARAEALFKRLAASKPADARLRTFVATSSLGGAADPAAVAGQLEAIAAEDGGITADLALVAARLRAGQADAALAAVQAIARKQPGQPLSHYLEALVLHRRGDAAGARRAFEAALQQDAGYLPAVAGLAGLDLDERQPAQAKARFVSLLERQPGNVAARLALAELLARAGAPAPDVAAQLNQALQAAPAQPDVRLALIRHEIGQGRWREAQSVAQAAVAALPDNVELLGELARIQERRGDAELALANFGKLAARSPGAATGHLGMARVHLAAGQWEDAQRSVDRALAAEPAQLEALGLLATLRLRQGRFDAALEAARRIQAARPHEAVGFLVEAEVAAAQGRWAEVAAASRTALGKTEPGLAPMKLHHALVRMGQPGQARAFSERWLHDHPTDVAFRFYLADTDEQAGDLAAAERGYRGVLALDARHPAALNNLGMLRLRAGQADAQEFIERAVAAAPDNPAVLDTQARLHAAQGRWASAVAVQAQAVSLAPRAADLRLSLARYQRSAGQPADATAGLRRMVDERLTLTAAQRAELQALLQATR